MGVRSFYPSRAHAQGVTAGGGGTKVDTSRNLSIRATGNHRRKTGFSMPLVRLTSVTNSACCWPRLSTVQAMCFLLMRTTGLAWAGKGRQQTSMM